MKALRIVIGIVLLAAALAIIVVAGDRLRGGQRAKADGALDAAAADPEPAPPPMPESFFEARDAYRPMMTDTVEQMSEGAALFAYWSVDHLDWYDINFDNETSFKAFRKDPLTERAKRLCAKGRIVQIRREPLADKSMFTGILSTKRGDIIVFFAVGSTGDLVEGSKARFCGLATGNYAYSNNAGGSSEGIAAVGMFDLPENRGK